MTRSAQAKRDGCGVISDPLLPNDPPKVDKYSDAEVWIRMPANRTA